MHCTQCGGPVPDNSAYCPNCGQRLADDDEWTGHDPPADELPQGADRMRAGDQRTGREQEPEEDLWSGTYSPRAMVGPAIGAGLATIVGAVLASFAGPVGWTVWAIAVVLLWLWLGAMLAYRRLTVRYRLSTYRFFHEIGLLRRVGNRIEVIDIDDVTVNQGLVERMFGVGTIHIQSSDRSDPELSLPGIEDAKQVADLIDSTRRAERHRRGLHIESI